MRVIFKCDVCGSVFQSSIECEKHEEVCVSNRISWEDKQRIISEIATAIVNDFIENPKVLLDNAIEYLREINKDLDVEDKTDLDECGFKDLFDLFAEMNEDSFRGNNIRIDEIRDKCFYDFERYVYKTKK